MRSKCDKNVTYSSQIDGIFVFTKLSKYAILFMKNIREEINNAVNL